MRHPSLPPPFLKRVTLVPERVPAEKGHPFDLPLFREGSFELAFERPVTVLVGENGVGKSTLLEAIAGQIGFSMQSGTRNFASDEDAPPLARCLRLAWLPKVATDSSRAQKACSISRHRSTVSTPIPIRNSALRSLTVTAGFRCTSNRTARRSSRCSSTDSIRRESTCSTNRRRRFRRHGKRRMERSGNAQVILATHAPMIMAYPGADLLVVKRDGIRRGQQNKTHWRILADLLPSPRNSTRTISTGSVNYSNAPRLGLRAAPLPFNSAAA